MKVFLFSIVMMAWLSPFAQTNAELTEQASRSYRKTDKKLNNIYQQILELYQDDTVFIKQLKITQRQWIKFRDAQVKMRYPDDYQDCCGTSTSLCIIIYREEIVKDRIKQLQEWVDGGEEGNVCWGTIKIDSEIMKLKKKK